jgi:hypothetical protein
MYTLFNNIVFDIIHSVVICVDFLGTHMVSLVLLFKTGCDNITWNRLGQIRAIPDNYSVLFLFRSSGIRRKSYSPLRNVIPISPYPHYLKL